ncbi:Ig-like domain-containing protein, partial [Desertibacillus haloalkaliphilus]|uniref:Ig-like domain-containing protein n=1 Tax=Desertibacillus haloalkaliphilus TaxID=1328930 RepID=UPI001C257255
WSTYDDYYGTTTIDDDGSGYPVNERVTTRTTLTPPSGFGGNVNGENTRVNAQYVDNIELVTADPGNIQPAMNPNISGLNRTTHDVEITGNVGGDVFGNSYNCSNGLEGLFFEFPIEATWTGEVNYTYSIELEPHYQSVGEGETNQFHAYVTTHYPDGSTNRSRVTNRSETTWDVSNGLVASVDQSGVVTGVSEGRTEVSATFQDPNRGINITATGTVDVDREADPPPSEPDPTPPSGNINAIATGPTNIEAGQRLELDGTNSTSTGEIVEWQWYRYNNGEKSELNFYYDGVDTPNLVRNNTSRLVTPQDRTYLLEIKDSNGRTDTDIHTVRIEEEVPDYVLADIRFEQETLPSSVNITQEQYEADKEMTISVWVTAEHSQYTTGSRAPMWFFSDVNASDISDVFPALGDDNLDHSNFIEYRNPPLNGISPDWDDSTIRMDFTYRPKSDPYIRAGLVVRSNVTNHDLYDHDIAVWEVPIPTFPSLRIDPPKKTIESGETADYTALYSPPDRNWEMVVDDAAEWTVEDGEIAEHVGDGQFKGLQPGTTTVTVEYSDDFDEVYGLTDTAVLDVLPGKPEAIIEGPSIEYMRETVTFDGSSSIANGGDIVEYRWTIDNEVELEGETIELSYDKEGTHEIELTVRNEYDKTDTTAVTLEILPDYPVADIDTRGSFKENRRVILDARNSVGAEATGRFEVDHSQTEWEITPLDGQDTDGIFYKQETDGSNEVLLALFRERGKYQIRNRVVNEKGDQSLEWFETTIEIEPDLPPEIDFTVTPTVYRDPDNNNNATVTLTDLSESPDGDFIQQRIWSYRYDSNNDGTFNNEEWIIIDQSNLSELSLSVENVGYYEVKLEIKEGFGQPTIVEFINDSLYKEAETTRTFKVDNRAPSVDWGY